LLPLVILLSVGLMHMYLMNVSNVYQVRLASLVMELQRINLSNANDKMESDKKLIARLKYARKAYKNRYDYYNSKWQHTFTAWQIMPEVDISLEGIPYRGPSDATNEVVIYSDFQCPSCRVFANTIEKRIMPLAKKYGPARFYFKHWPISKEGCNPYAGTNLHPQACDGARAAEAAHLLGGNDAFWKMHDMLFARRKEWTKDTDKLVGYADQIGLDPQAFKKKMYSDEVSRRIKEQAREGYELGKDKVDEDERKWVKVSGTPAVYINGKKLNTTHHVRTWVNILRMGARTEQADKQDH
jgi:protein-disulfide isomerase